MGRTSIDPKSFLKRIEENLIALEEKKGQDLVVTINQELIEQEARFDGYFCLVTSELHFDHQEIKQIYGNLWEIEDTFRVTKTDLKFRPIHHYKHERIIAHFLICFMALIILRLFQHKWC
jgi:transposase